MRSKQEALARFVPARGPRTTWTEGASVSAGGEPLAEPGIQLRDLLGRRVLDIEPEQDQGRMRGSAVAPLAVPHPNLILVHHLVEERLLEVSPIQSGEAGQRALPGAAQHRGMLNVVP